jgi:hypothetical protein
LRFKKNSRVANIPFSLLPSLAHFAALHLRERVLEPNTSSYSIVHPNCTGFSDRFEHLLIRFVSSSVHNHTRMLEEREKISINLLFSIAHSIVKMSLKFKLMLTQRLSLVLFHGIFFLLLRLLLFFISSQLFFSSSTISADSLFTDHFTLLCDVCCVVCLEFNSTPLSSCSHSFHQFYGELLPLTIKLMLMFLIQRGKRSLWTFQFFFSVIRCDILSINIIFFRFRFITRSIHKHLSIVGLWS